jgi:hypothetical protein
MSERERDAERKRRFRETYRTIAIPPCADKRRRRRRK